MYIFIYIYVCEYVFMLIALIVGGILNFIEEMKVRVVRRFHAIDVSASGVLLSTDFTPTLKVYIHCEVMNKVGFKVDTLARPASIHLTYNQIFSLLQSHIINLCL